MVVGAGLTITALVAPVWALAKLSVIEYGVCRWWGPAPGGAERSIIVAHRGYRPNDSVCENSTRSIEAALTAGFTGIEIDINFTRDQVPVVFHDQTLERLTDSRGPLDALNWAELRRVHLFDGQPIVSLAEFWERYAGRFALVCIDLKCTNDRPMDRAEALSAAMPPGPQTPRTLVVGVPYQVLRETARLRPDFHYACETLGAIANRLVGFDAVSASYDKFSAGQVRLARRLGMPYLVWTLNAPERVTAAETAGVDAYITDRPPATWRR